MMNSDKSQGICAYHRGSMGVYKELYKAVYAPNMGKYAGCKTVKERKSLKCESWLAQVWKANPSLPSAYCYSHYIPEKDRETSKCPMRTRRITIYFPN